MSARDVMISTLKERPNDPYGAAYWLEAALTAAGYTIVREDEVLDEAIELLADCLKKFAPISAENHRKRVIAFLAQHRQPAGRAALQEGKE